MPVYNLKRVAAVPTASELVDIVLMRTQRKTPTVIHPGYKISRIRSFYMRKVKFTSQTISERIGAIVSEFPRLDDVHPFHADLMSVLYDRDHYKLALGQLNTCKKLCESVCRDYVRLLKYADSLYRCKCLKVAALGRMMTLIKRHKASLSYLEEVRKHMGRLPALDPTARTLLICGFPNVGKSSFMNKVTRAEVDVQPYAFTTKSLYVGHMDHKYLRWQVVDTPGILDHQLEKRNVIEMQAVTALAHLPCAILFFVDISEQCGYTIEQQSALYHSVRPLFADKQLVVVANKTDVRGLDQLGESDRKLLDDMCAAHDTNGPESDERAKIVEMSNVTESGVNDVKNLACELLLAARVEKRRAQQGGARVKDKMHRLVVAQPVRPSTALPASSDGDRQAFVPASVKAARKAKKLAMKAREAQDLADRDDDAWNAAVELGARPEALDEVARRAKRSRAAADSLAAVAPALNKVTTERDRMWNGGGPGVYSADLTREYKGMLRDDAWTNDIVPEIMDGKNVADFVDPDVVEKLAQLEDDDAAADDALAEAELFEAQNSLSPAEAALVNAVREKRRANRLKSQLNKNASKRNILPRNKLLKRKTRENDEAGPKRGRSLTRDDDAMDVDDDNDEPVVKRARASSSSVARSASRPPPRSETGLRDIKQKAAATKLARKLQRHRNRLARAGESDRKTGPKLLRWRVEGKMSSGTRRSR